MMMTSHLIKTEILIMTTQTNAVIAQLFYVVKHDLKQVNIIDSSNN